MWAKIITIKRTKDLNYFSLCALNLFNTRVSQFEMNYWNKLTFPQHSNLLRCTCILFYHSIYLLFYHIYCIFLFMHLSVWSFSGTLMDMTLLRCLVRSWRRCLRCGFSSDGGDQRASTSPVFMTTIPVWSLLLLRKTMMLYEEKGIWFSLSTNNARLFTGWVKAVRKANKKNKIREYGFNVVEDMRLL